MAIDVRARVPHPLTVACDSTVDPHMRLIAWQLFELRSWADAVLRGLYLSSLDCMMRSLVEDELRMRELRHLTRLRAS
jgi:hypothetical protein